MGKTFTSVVCLSLICSLVVLSLSIANPTSCHSAATNNFRNQAFLQSLPMILTNAEQANSKHCLNRVVASQAQFSNLQQANLQRTNLQQVNLQQKVSINLGKESMAKNQLADQSDCMGCCVPLSQTIEPSTHQHHTFVIVLKTGVKMVSLTQPKRPPKSTIPHLYTNNTVI